ncbi:MAG: right-handed parallel beta-helix repeat-containing protein [Methanospirillum sp.]
MKPPVLLLLLLLASAAQAADLSGPGEITAPGSYRLADDLAGGGIRINSSDVLLDGGGHRVVGSRGAGTVGVQVDGPAANVTVENLTLRDWDVGVEYASVQGGRIVDVNAENCTKNGLFIDRCRDLEVRNTVAGRNGYPGIALNGSTACRVVNATATANGDVGIYLLGSAGCTVEASISTANLLNGVCLEGPGTGAVVGCTLDRNGYPGVAVNGGRKVLISGNIISDNRLAAVWLDGTGPCVVTRNAAVGDGAGLVVRNATVRPLTGGNLWLTPRQVDGGTVPIPSLFFPALPPLRPGA